MFVFGVLRLVGCEEFDEGFISGKSMADEWET